MATTKKAPAKAPAAREQPYKSPKPIYSEADYKRQLDQDFGYARAAAGVATSNKKQLINAQADAQSRAQTKAIAAQSLAEGRSLAIKGGIERGLLDKKVKAGKYDTDAKISGQLQDTQLRTQGQLANTQAQVQGRQKTLETEIQAARDSRGGMGSYDADLSRMQTRAMNADQDILRSRQMNALPDFNQGRSVSGGMSGSFSQGGSLSLPPRQYAGGGGAGSAMYYAPPPPREDSLSKGQEEQFKLERERMQAQREGADQNRQLERDRLQYQREAPGLNAAAQSTIIKAQGENEEELRRKAAMRALATFSAAKPSYQPAIA